MDINQNYPAHVCVIIWRGEEITRERPHVPESESAITHHNNRKKINNRTTSGASLFFRAQGVFINVAFVWSFGGQQQTPRQISAGLLALMRDNAPGRRNTLRTGIATPHLVYVHSFRFNNKLFAAGHCGCELMRHKIPSCCCSALGQVRN